VTVTNPLLFAEFWVPPLVGQEWPLVASLALARRFALPVARVAPEAL